MQLTREEILAIYDQGPEAVVQLVEILLDTIEKLSERVAHLEEENQRLKERIRTLEARLEMNSRNSHKPPSSDGLKKPPPPKRKKGKRKSGGQKGHKGHTLKMVDDPHHIENHSPESCSGCGCSLENINAQEEFEKRQVFDLPPCQIEVCEHRSLRKVCPDCGELNKAPFPEGVEAPAQYGPRIKAVVAYLNCYQLIPLKRSCEMIEDLFGHQVSEAMIIKATCALYEILKPVEDAIKQGLLASSVLNVDETGISVEGKLSWLHVTSTIALTLYVAHKKRGSEALDFIGILLLFMGTIVHDCWKPYFKYHCRHALCNAHISRELKFVHEVVGQLWADEMKELLLDIKAAVDDRKEKGFESLSWWKRRKFKHRYEEILDSGFMKNPLPDSSGEPKKRGKPKKTKQRNLLERMRDYQNEILLFMEDFQVPFSNNRAENDLRMAKVKQKISGTFRSWEGAHVFCRVRSYVSTVKKNSIPVMNSLEDAFNGKPFMPVVTQS